MKFTHAENFVIRVICTLIVIVALTSWFKGMRIDVGMFDLAFLVDILFILAGQYFRSIRRNEHIAVPLTVIGLALATGQMVAALNYSYLPYAYFGFDQFLAGIDARLGYVWSEFATGFAAWPKTAALLRIVYDSSQAQIMLMIVLLGLTRNGRTLEEFMLVLTIGVLTCVSVWVLFPSSSPVGFQPLAAGVAERLNLTLSPELGAELVRLSREAIKSYPPQEVQGMVGFPSFHTVMLIATVRAARPLRLLFPAFLIWNLLMFPAILLHGAHNLVDVFGGLAVSALSVHAARKIMLNQPQTPEWMREPQTAPVPPALPGKEAAA